jgi:hypothetical protein
MKVETIGALEGRYGDRQLGVSRRQQSKKRTQGDGGSRKKLAAFRRRMTCRALPALRKGRVRKATGRGNVARDGREDMTKGTRQG